MNLDIHCVDQADTRGKIMKSQHYLQPGTTYNDPTDSDTGYSVEMQIPWLKSPLDGTLLKLNLLSVDHDQNPDTKFNDPDTIFSKVFWDNDNTVDEAGGYLSLQRE
jgi:hypothetical protein